MIEVTEKYIKIFDDKKDSCISYNRNYYKVAYVGDCISIVKKDFNERNKSLHTNSVSIIVSVYAVFYLD